jgi:hypothetical protein
MQTWNCKKIQEKWSFDGVAYEKTWGIDWVGFLISDSSLKSLHLNSHLQAVNEVARNKEPLNNTDLNTIHSREKVCRV